MVYSLSPNNNVLREFSTLWISATFFPQNWPTLRTCQQAKLNGLELGVVYLKQEAHYFVPNWLTKI